MDEGIDEGGVGKGVTGQVPSRDRDATARVIATMSRVVANTLHHRWLSASDQRDAVRDAFRALESWFASSGEDELYLRMLGDELNASGTLLDAAQAEVAAVASQMDVLALPSLAILKGMTAGEYGPLLEILSARPAELDLLGGFQAFAAKVGVEHAVVRNIVLREVTEDDVIVRKSRGAAVVPADGDTRAELVRFLQGDAAGDDAAQGALASAQSDAAGVGGLILDAARESADVGLAVGEAVRRAFDCWMKSPAAQTQKGKKELSRFVGQLQGWLKENAPDGVGASEGVAEAFDAIGDELKMDALASEYLRKRKAISDSEERILRYIRRKGREGIDETDLERRLLSGGLGGSDWRDLIVKSGLAGAGGSEEAVRFLSERLLMWENLLRESGLKGGDDPAKLASDLKRIAVDVDALAADTNRKVQDLIEEYRREDAEAEAGGAAARVGKPRRQLYAKLSEIGQELCQPLSVINCSISMIKSGRLGEVSGAQKDMLNLAGESSQKLQQIVDSLMVITGVPKGLEPDAKVQAEIYR